MTTNAESEFTRLRQSARTPEDFRGLAAFCRGQAEVYQSRAESSTAGSEIFTIHRELAQRWTELAELYHAQGE